MRHALTSAAGGRHGDRPRWLLLALLSALGWAWGQGALPAPAQEALQRGQRIAAEAQLTYANHFPDQPLWAQALAAGRIAADAAPDHPAPQRFLAQVYGQTSWYFRAWQSWQAYLDLGGQLDAAASRQLLEAALFLGLATFDEGRVDEAQPYLEMVVRLDPAELRAHARLAQLFVDRGDLVAARPSLLALGETLTADLLPALEQAERLVRYGEVAADAYEAGRAAATDANWARAAERFAEAVAAAPDFVDAWRGRAAAATAMGNPDAAVGAWQRVLAVLPDDAEATAGLASARTRAAVGVAAYDAFTRGVQAYQSGAIGEARSRFEEAATRNASFTDAHAWLGRIALETGDPVSAVARYRTATALAPSRADLRQALATAESRLAEAQAATAPPAPPPEPQGVDATPASPVPAAAAPTPTASAPQPAAPTPPPPETTAVAEPRPPSGRLAEVVLVDAVVTHRAATAGGQGAFTFIDTAELRRDLGDYVDGRLYLRLDVRSKPSQAPIAYQLCLVTDDIYVPPACVAPQTLTVRTPGLLAADVALRDLPGGATLDWGRGITQVMLVLRHPDGSPIDDRLLPSQGERSGLDPTEYFPMDVRFTAVLVAPGEPAPTSP